MDDIIIVKPNITPQPVDAYIDTAVKRTAEIVAEYEAQLVVINQQLDELAQRKANIEKRIAAGRAIAELVPALFLPTDAA